MCSSDLREVRDDKLQGKGADEGDETLPARVQEVAEEHIQEVDQVQDIPQEQAQEVVVPQEQGQEVPQEVPQDDAAFLQPLVPSAARRPRAGRKGGRPLVDATIQLRHQDIREMMETGWRRTLRCEHPSQDLVMVQQLKTGKAGFEVGEELREWCQGEQRKALRPRAWEWLEQEAVVQIGRASCRERV